MVIGSACVALFLGWQAAAVLVPITMVVAGMLSLVIATQRRKDAMRMGRKWVPAIAWLGVSALGWILLWASLVDRWPMLG